MTKPYSPPHSPRNFEPGNFEPADVGVTRGLGRTPYFKVDVQFKSGRTSVWTQATHPKVSADDEYFFFSKSVQVRISKENVEWIAWEKTSG